MVGMCHTCRALDITLRTRIFPSGPTTVFPAAFPEACACDILWIMTVSTWLRRLLPILAIVGLVAGPFTAAVDGNAIAAAIITSEMPDDMPCCPSEAPAVPDCPKTCPLMAICVTKCFPAAPMLFSAAFVLCAEGNGIQPRSDVMGDALAVEPPARPPRT